MPFTLTEKSRCGPVESPVLPTLPMVWPFLTSAPTETSWADRWEVEGGQAAAVVDHDYFAVPAHGSHINYHSVLGSHHRCTCRGRYINAVVHPCGSQNGMLAVAEVGRYARMARLSQANAPVAWGRSLLARCRAISLKISLSWASSRAASASRSTCLPLPYATVHFLFLFGLQFLANPVLFLDHSQQPLLLGFQGLFLLIYFLCGPP